MAEILPPEKKLHFSIMDEDQDEALVRLGKALAVPDRVRILRLLQAQPMNLLEISRTLSIPVSSVSNHIQALREARLIFVSYQPGLKGHVKLCAKAVCRAELVMDEPRLRGEERPVVSFEMPVGQFTDCRVVPPCGMAGSSEILEQVDDPRLFFSPLRAKAQLLWFQEGFVTYRFPAVYPNGIESCRRLSFSFEACSETIYYRNDWPSDITVSINGVEVLTFTSPGDFGGRPGRYTPAYWSMSSTQFGELRTISVDAEGAYMNGVRESENIRLETLQLDKSDSIQLTLEIKSTAVHRGGLNLFGKGFGDHPQDIRLTLE